MRKRSFVGIYAKLDRAKEHGEVLTAEIKRISDELSAAENISLARVAIDAALPVDTPNGVAAIAGVRSATATANIIPPLTVEHGMIFGDILHNYRAALDHLAWVLAHRGGPYIKAKEARNIQFPLATGKRSFGNQRFRIPGCSAAEWALVGRYQPYHRSSLGRVMRTLRNLSDTDKHRIVVPVWTSFFSSDAQFHAVGNYRIVWWRPLIQIGDRIKPGTKLAQVFFAGVDSPESAVGLLGNMTLTPLLPGDLQLEGFLNDLDTTCREIVDHFASS